MTNEGIPAEAVEAIERTRQLVRGLASRLGGHGLQPIDIALGIAYALHDVACEVTGHPIEAVEWQRNCIDTFERQHMTGGSNVHPN